MLYRLTNHKNKIHVHTCLFTFQQRWPSFTSFIHRFNYLVKVPKCLWFNEHHNFLIGLVCCEHAFRLSSWFITWIMSTNMMVKLLWYFGFCLQWMLRCFTQLALAVMNDESHFWLRNRQKSILPYICEILCDLALK